MAEYIERELVLKTIRDNFCTYFPNVLDVVRRIPTADVQPVVHCKDCKYAQNPNDTMIYCTYFECGTMSQNDFCSQGERRTEK